MMLLLAPHANSYDRLQPGAHAPTGVAWAYENRTAAIRVPRAAQGAPPVEHRVAGGDINPYLMMAGDPRHGADRHRGRADPAAADHRQRLRPRPAAAAHDLGRRDPTASRPRPR
jgi:glutamine synthetase